MKLGVLISGGGSNLQAIIDACESKKINAEIPIVISNNKTAYGLKRAENHGIKAICIDPIEYPDRERYDTKILEHLREHEIDLLILAGYMRLIGKPLLPAYAGRAMNIHPSLLPAFSGTNAIKDAYDYGAKITGVTVHFVDKGMDTGPIILQESCHISDNDTVEALAEKIHSIEHRLYPEAIKLFCEGKLKLEERKVKIIK